MKKAISTLACNGWTLEKTLAVCNENCIDALEMRMGLHAWSQLTQPDSTYYEMHQAITASGLVVCNLGTSIVIAQEDMTALQELERCAQIANVLQCKGLRIMLGNFYTKRSEARKPMDYEGIIRWLTKADALMEHYGTEIWIETHNEFATGKALFRLLEDAKLCHTKLIWDIMHPLEAGELLEESYKLVKSHLAHVHIKDGKPWDDEDMENYCYTRIGEGNIEIRKVLQLLQQGGYDGYYSLEWEGVWRKEIQGTDFAPENEITAFSSILNEI